MNLLVRAGATENAELALKTYDELCRGVVAVCSVEVSFQFKATFVEDVPSDIAPPKQLRLNNMLLGSDISAFE